LSKLKWIITIIVAVVIVIGLSFYLNGKLCWIREASAVNTVRRVVPGGPAQFLAQDGNYVVAVGIVSEENDDCALYLYDTKGTFDDFSDDTYTIIDQIDSDNGWFTHTTIDGDYITWIDSTGWSSCTALKLKCYCISAESLFVISSNVTDYTYSRDGNLVVYECRGNDSDIKLFNLNTRVESNICTADGFQKHPYIKNNIIVWEDLRNEATTGKDIYMYNLETNTEGVVSNEQGEQKRAITNGNYVVYESSVLGKKKIVKFEISTGNTEIIAETTSEAISIKKEAINDNYFVWEKIVSNSNNNLSTFNEFSSINLYLHNLSTSSNTLIEKQIAPIDDPLSRYVFLNNNNQLVYGGYFKIIGFDITQNNKYVIRSTGKTWWVNLNSENDIVIMHSHGVGNNANEWDVSLAFIP